MNKNALIKFIDKYSFSDNLEKVKWVISRDTNSIYVGEMTPNYQGGASVSINFKSDINLQNLEFGIATTSTLKKMLNVLSDEITLTPTILDDKLRNIIFSDGKVEMQYCASIIFDNSVYDIDINDANKILSFNITNELSNNIIKAKSALSSEKVFQIVNINKQAYFSIGYTLNNTDRINMKLPCTDSEFSVQSILNFNINYLKSILEENENILFNLYELNKNYCIVLTSNEETEFAKYICEYVLFPIK